MIDLNEIKVRLLKGEQIENIIHDIDWKDFEKLIAKILKKHDFNVYNNFRFKTERRFEIDILAIKNDVLLAIDCKQWGRGRYKKTALKYSVKEQIERAKQLKKFFSKALVDRTKLEIQKNTKFIPLLVTWFEEEFIEYDNIFIVPVWKFNEFLLSISEHI